MSTIYTTPDYTEYWQIKTKWKFHQERALKAVSSDLQPPSSPSTMPFLSVLRVILGTFLLIGILCISNCNQAYAKAPKSLLIEGYTIDQWVNAIRKAEGNDNYGILSVKCEKGQECRRICANTVRNNYKRWERSGKTIPYLQFLGNRYCPVGASNDPTGLNRHWVKNVSYFLKRGA